ncbi:MAG: Ig-like domain-containing protein [Vagococcus sp.]|uniref:Ig-like domain-containing protein n=1 Tax=Vagococcus TaxID=2737 RepID=UPI002FCC2142
MKKIVKIGMALVVVVALFLSMPSLKTLGDFITSKDKESKSNIHQLPAEVPRLSATKMAQEIATGKDFGTEFLDSVKITDEDGNPFKEPIVIERGQRFKVIYSWSIPDDVELKEGDYMTIPLPPEANIYNSVMFPVHKDGDPDKEKMGTAYLDHKTNVITMVFTDYPDGKSDVNGLLEFYVKLQVEKNEKPIKVPIEFETKDGVEVIEIEVPGESEDGNSGGPEIVEIDRYLHKYGSQGQELGQMHWNVFVNEKAEELFDVVVVDTLGENQVLDQDSLRVRRGKQKLSNGNISNSEGIDLEDLDIEYRKNGFTINFGDIDEYIYHISYSSTIEEGYEVLDEERFFNDVIMTASGKDTIEDSDYVAYVTGSGSGTGKDIKKFGVTEKYLDKATGEKLAKDNLTKFEIPFKETATFKTDTKLIEGYELVEYSTKIGDKEKTTDISDGQTIRMEVDEDTEITYYYEESKFASHIYLRTKDNQLVIHYRNVDQLIVEVDGQQYETYDVLAQETDENISTPIRVNSDRTVVRVRGKLSGQDAAEASLNSKKTKK